MKFLRSISSSQKTPMFMAILFVAVYAPSVQAHIDGTHHMSHPIAYGVVAGLLLLAAIGLLIQRSKSRL